MQNIKLDNILRQHLFKLKENCIYKLDDNVYIELNKVLIDKGWMPVSSGEKIRKIGQRISIKWNDQEILNTEIHNLTAFTLALPFALPFTLSLALPFATVEGQLFNMTDNISFWDEQKEINVSPLQKNYLELYD